MDKEKILMLKKLLWSYALILLVLINAKAQSPSPLLYLPYTIQDEGIQVVDARTFEELTFYSIPGMFPLGIEILSNKQIAFIQQDSRFAKGIVIFDLTQKKVIK